MRKKKALSPRQATCRALYLDPNSKTFGNAFASAVEAGFSAKYAKNITKQSTKWLGEISGKYEKIAEKAEKNLEEILDADEREIAMGPLGPLVNKETGEPILIRNSKVLGIKLDATKFALERLRKKDFGRPEHGPRFVVPIQVNVNEDREKYQ